MNNRGQAQGDLIHQKKTKLKQRDPRQLRLRPRVRRLSGSNKERPKCSKLELPKVTEGEV